MFTRPRRLAATFTLLAVAAWLLPAQDPSPIKEVVATYSGHTETVYATAISPDGRLLLTGSFDRTVKLWDLASGKELRTFGGDKGHQNLVLAVAFAPDGQTFASGGSDNTVKIWDVPAQQPLRELALGEGAKSAALSPDGKTAAAGASDGAITIFDPTEGKVLFTLNGHVGAVTGLSYAPNNAALLASVGVDGTLRFWNLADGKPVAVIVAHDKPIQAVAFATGANAVFTAAEDGRLKFWQAPPIGERPLAGHTDTVRSLALSLDGNTAVTGSTDRTVRLFNVDSAQLNRAMEAPQPLTAVASAGNGVTLAGTSTGQVLAWGADGTLQFQAVAHSGEVTGLAVHPNGTPVVSVGADGQAIVWELPFQPAKNYPQPTDAKLAMPTADGKRVYIVGADDQARLVDVRNGQVNATHAVSATQLTASADGAAFASVGPDQVIRWQKREDAKPTVLPEQAGVVSLSLHPNGSQLLVAYADGNLKLWPVPFPENNAKPVWEANLPGVTRVAIEPKGTQYVAIGGDKALHMGELPTGKELKAIPVQAAPTSGLAFNADGTLVAVAGEDQSVKIFNLGDDQERVKIALPSAATRFALTPKGERLAVAYPVEGKTAVSVFDAVSGRKMLTIEDRFDVVASLAFDPASRQLQVVADKTIILTDVPTTRSLAVHAGGATGAVFLPNGSLLTGGVDKMARQWDLVAGTETRAFGPLPEPIHAVAVSRDGAQVAAAAGKIAKIWNAGDGAESATLTHPAEVISLGFHPDRTRMVTGTTDNLARVWDVAKGQMLQAFSHGAAVHGVVIPPNKPTLVVSASADKTAAVHTVTLQRLVDTGPQPLRALAIHPNGAHLLAAGDDPAVKLVNLGNGNVERTFAGAGGPVLAVAISKNQQLVAAIGADKIGRLYNAGDGNLLGQFTAAAPIRGLTFHPNNTAIFTSGDDNLVTLWNIAFQPGNPLPPEFGKPTQTFAHPAAVPALALNSDGSLLLSAGADKRTRVWKVAAEGPTKNFGHPNLVDAIAYSADGKQLATACHDGNVRIWDIEKGAVAKEIKAHATPQPSAVYCIAWSPDGKQLASGSLDKSIKIWDAASGNLVREIKGYDEKMAPKGHQDGVFTLAWSPDGTQLVSGSSDRSIKMWNVADGAHVRDLVNANLPALPMQPPPAHPGWVYHLRYTPGGHLVSVGGAPRNRGYIALWNPADGQPLAGVELPLGPFYHVALNADGTRFAVACGPRGRQVPQADAVLLKLGDGN